MSSTNGKQMSTVVETTAIYANYRNALKAERKNGAIRAGARKQNALRVTARRYKVAISEVKNIVRAAEADFGITHDHPEQYVKEQAFLSRARYAEKILKKRAVQDHGKIACVHCGTHSVENVVEARVNMQDLANRGELSFSLQCFPCWMATVPEDHAYRTRFADFSTILDAWDYTPEKP